MDYSESSLHCEQALALYMKRMLHGEDATLAAVDVILYAKEMLEAAVDAEATRATKRRLFEERTRMVNTVEAVLERE